MVDRTVIEALGEALLARKPSPIPCFRIYRDVLQYPKTARLYTEARSRAVQDPHVLELQTTQEPDGSWGRFHSRDSRTRRIFPTTEIAVDRALALGLDGSHEVLRKAVRYMEDHLEGREEWSDPPEKHEGWKGNIRFITAATLAKIDAGHPLLSPLAETWVEVVRRVFASGWYSPLDEQKAHFDIHGIHSKEKFLKLASTYPLILLSKTGTGLPSRIELALLDWIWNKPDGIYYSYNGCLKDPPPLGSRSFPVWLDALELFAGFPEAGPRVEPLLAWIWDQKGPDGLWDFGPRAIGSTAFPMSGNWRKAADRKIDCSVRVLAFLRQNAERGR